MNSTKKLKATEICLNLALAAVSPLQNLIDKPGVTHEFCNRQALQILRHDGFSQYAGFFSQFTRELNHGVYWADQGWKNIHHYLDPCSGKGLWHFAAAVDNFTAYYHMALSSAKGYDFKKAVFFLGAAAHLVQDMCVPHHARAMLFYGHQQYENWVQKHFSSYAVVSRGTYDEGRPIHSLLLSNAHTAADFFDWVKHNGDETQFAKTTAVLLPLAQFTTAGLFRHFANAIRQKVPALRESETVKNTVA